MFHRSNLVFLTGILFVFFLVACGGDSNKIQNATLESTTIIQNPTRGVGFQAQATSKFSHMDKEFQLPELLWPTFEYRMIAAGPRHAQVKAEFCVIDEAQGIPFTPGEKLEVIEEARCMNVYHMIPDSSPIRHVMGFTKVRVISTGQEGWTFSKVVRITE